MTKRKSCGPRARSKTSFRTLGLRVGIRPEYVLVLLQRFDGRMIKQLREAFAPAARKLECGILEMGAEARLCSPSPHLSARLAASATVNNL